MPAESPDLDITAGRRAAVGEEEKFAKNIGKSSKNDFCDFGGMGSPPTGNPLSLTQILEKDAGERSPSTSYRVPFKNLFSKPVLGRGNIFEKRGKRSSFWCSGPGGRGPEHGGTPQILKSATAMEREKEKIEESPGKMLLYSAGSLRLKGGDEYY